MNKTDINTEEYNAIFTEKDKICRDFQISKFNVRKIIPAVNMQVDVCVDRLLSKREKMNQYGKVHLSIYSFLLKEIADVLVQYPLLFSLFYKKKIIFNKTLIINVPVSVDNHVEYVCIQNPEKKNYEEIAIELQNGITAIKRNENLLMNALTAINRLNKIGALCYKIRNFKNPVYFLEKYYGYFPVTNFGTFNAVRGTIILSEPVVAGLLIGAMFQRTTADKEHLVNEKIITISLSFDHRVMDGAYAGHFLNDLKNKIETLG